MQVFTEQSNDLASELLPILKANDTGIRLHFYKTEDGKNIYIENDLVDKMVYIKHTGVDRTVGFKYKYNLDVLTHKTLSGMIEQALKDVYFRKQRETIKRVNQIQDKITKIVADI
jgi:hypothetical protein